MKKTVTIKEFTEELISRIDNAKSIECCKEEIKSLAAIAKENIGTLTIDVNWKD